jgi:FkbM family methyltransferase
MSDLNIDFLVNNFYDKKINFFNIGCSNLGDTIDFKNYLPNAKFYAFECNEKFRESNTSTAIKHGINYFHYALSDTEGKILFYPSDTLNGQKDWNISSSTLKPIPTEHFNLTYGEPYFVESIMLDKFCNENNISPDFIHIDAEGAEYKILSKLGDYRPYCIWSEICAFDVYYESGNSYEDFDNLLYGYGYIKLFSSNNDALYIHASFQVKDNKYI